MHLLLVVGKQSAGALPMSKEMQTVLLIKEIL